jgi:asparagine synthase (glutamine-hydrolysing)
MTQSIAPNLFYGFHRLKIMDVSDAGMQPMQLDDHLFLMCNGEIYNHHKLTEKYKFDVKSGSDCEVILHLYREFGGDIKKVAENLDGVFAFVLYDAQKETLFAGRDPIGVRPLFIGYDTENESIFLASESKAFVDYTSNLQQFPPGSVWNSKTEEFEKWWHLENVLHPKTVTANGNGMIRTESQALGIIHDTLCVAVEKRLMADRPIGTFLSGGLDSSLISSLVSRLNPYKVNTYAIGMEGSTDVYYAEKVAKFIQSNHTSVTFTADEGIAAVDEVIKELETFDVTTIRASVGMHLLSKYISQNTGDIVIYSGEGADEVMQGYLYFHNAPSALDGAKDSEKLMDNLHFFDVKRVDRCVSTHGLEVRVPFLDKEFMRNYFRIDPALRAPSYKGIEKYLLRKAFEDKNVLPSEVLWRTKEAFSDGISSLQKPWHEILRAFVDSIITDDEYERACLKYEGSNKIPIHKEAYYYRTIYEKYYGDVDLIPYYWMPMWSDAKDPSARTIGKYSELIS